MMKPEAGVSDTAYRNVNHLQNSCSELRTDRRHSMKYICPVCGGELIGEFDHHMATQFRIEEDGTLMSIDHKPGGGITVFCRNDKNHELGIELYGDLIDRIYDKV